MSRRSDADGVPDFLRALSREEGDVVNLPDPRLIVRRARVVARLAAEEAALARAARPVVIAAVSAPCVAVVLSALLATRSTAAAVLVLGVLVVAAAVPMVLASD